MNTTQQAMAAGVYGASLMMTMLIAVVLIVLLVIARWKIFTKAGEKGWKSIIPIYSDYVEWRIGWKKTGLFWLAILLVVGGVVLGYATGAFATDRAGQLVVTGMNQTMTMVCGALFLVAFILELVATYKLFASFGHGVGWLIGYIFVPGIMLLVLAFGSSRYLGARD